MPNYHVIGMSHIDLGFTITEEELDEQLEVFIERILYILDREPEVTFGIEQMSHYRKIKRDRPDLFKRVKEYIKEGRIEIMGAMASSMETNFPCGESFVRNQKLGLDWAKENLEAKPDIAWLVDTFGTNAQVPQIYNQFGFTQLFANRFGGDKMHQVFKAKGLDGSELVVMGVDGYSRNVRSTHLLFSFNRAWSNIENMFRQADRMKSPEPKLITNYIENEFIMSMLYIKRTKERQGREGENWILSSHKKYVEDLMSYTKEFPVLFCDLNPEFTGTFALRTPIKLANRKAENALLEAEKWSALITPEVKSSDFAESWWTMAFNQFHDVFTGSHTDPTYNSVLERYDEVITSSDKATASALSAITKADENAVTFTNSMPWERTEWIKLPEKFGGRKLLNGTAEVKTAVRGDEVFALVTMPAVGAVTYTVGDACSTCEPAKSDSCQISNEALTLKVDKSTGAITLTLADGTVIIDNAIDYITLQEDKGSMQIENLDGGEAYVTLGEVKVSPVLKDAMGEEVTLSGKIPYMAWNGGNNRFEWALTFRANSGEANIRLHLDVDWLGEGTRIRLNIPTTIHNSDAVYEIPFGVVERTAYRTRPTSKGEWPAHRFVAFEDTEKGVALINSGAAGVELNGRTLSTSLIRAYYPGPGAWVRPSALSSQHGKHSYDFMLVPYNGSWKNAAVLRMAQEFNSPARAFEACAVDGRCTSFASVDRDNIVLSTIKAADDNSGDLVIRVYESFGEATTATISIKDAKSAVLSNVNEIIGEDISCKDGKIAISVKPFEILTIRVKR